MIGVLAARPGYRVAIGALPLSVRPAPPGAVAGAVVVIDGAAGWAARAVAAADAGAAALVVADPVLERSHDDAVVALAGRLPVVLDRPHLRHDVATAALLEDAGAGWAFVSAQCSAPAGRLPELLADAAGWLREIAGPLEVEAVRGAGDGVLASLRGERGGVSVTARRLAGAGPRIAVTAVAPRRLEVTIAPGSLPAVRWTDEQGAVAAPARFESRERLALRRAVAALDAGDPVPDLGDHLADAAIAAILGDAIPA